MAIYTKKEFAGLCKIETKALSVYIKRGKVVLDEDDKINTDFEKNKAFLEKVYGRIDFVPKVIDEEKPKPSTKHTQALREQMEPTELSEEDIAEALKNCGGMSYVELERVYKYLQGEKLKSEIEKNKIEIDKKKGILIPSEPVIPVILQHNQHILMEQKNADEEMLTAFAHKYSISGADVAFIRGEWVKRRNSAIQKATDSSVKGVNAIINDFSEKRGVGQRNG